MRKYRKLWNSLDNCFHSRQSQDHFGAVLLPQLRFSMITLQWAVGLFQIYQHGQVWLNLLCTHNFVASPSEDRGMPLCPLTQPSRDRWSWYFNSKCGKVNPCGMFPQDSYPIGVKLLGKKKKKKGAGTLELESKKNTIGSRARKILLVIKSFKGAWCTAFHKLTILEFYNSPIEEI